MIHSKPSTAVYRDAWERVFTPKPAVGDRVVWHAPFASPDLYRYEPCRCDKRGAIVALAPQPNGYIAVIGVQLDSGGVIDPSIDPALLRPEGESCPLGGGPLIPVGASVD